MKKQTVDSKNVLVQVNEALALKTLFKNIKLNVEIKYNYMSE